MTKTQVTTDQIRTLRDEAVAAGDGAQTKLCDLALGGCNPDAFRACVEAIQDAEAVST